VPELFGQRQIYLTMSGRGYNGGFSLTRTSRKSNAGVAALIDLDKLRSDFGDYALYVSMTKGRNTLAYMHEKDIAISSGFARASATLELIEKQPTKMRLNVAVSAYPVSRHGAGRAAKSISDPYVWSGRALQEVRRAGDKRSCINVSGL
jgi:hypothetical protein